RRGRRLRRALAARPWTLWRYRELLPLVDFDGRVDLGEGGTPLVPLVGAGAPARLWLKNEAGNPTGSFKDRGMALAVTRARELGAPGVELASAGNAAISLAAYATAAGLPWRVALPADAPEAVERRCRAHGGEVLRFPGTLVEAGQRLAEQEGDFWNVSTLREPYRVEGKKTMGLELAEQFDWRLPEWIVYPTGGGTGILGMRKAFDELAAAGLLRGPRPRFVVVQMAGCAPIVRAFERGEESAEPWVAPQTRVWGLRVPRALGDFLILEALRLSGGLAVAVDEAAIAERQAETARRHGLAIGPEGAAALEAALGLVESGRIGAGERVVVFQTGHPANYGG
ncbi:MAG: threonine synthase, partial [Thermoanaerobaculia bacterium]|nr:threonine synthase [Thermoanaerobaculia bacterium]